MIFNSKDRKSKTTNTTDFDNKKVQTNTYEDFEKLITTV